MDGVRGGGAINRPVFDGFLSRTVVIVDVFSRCQGSVLFIKCPYYGGQMFSRVSVLMGSISYFRL